MSMPTPTTAEAATSHGGARGRLLLLLSAIVLVLGLGAVAWHMRDAQPAPTGDPDPGGRLLAQLEPVLDVVPNSAHSMNRDIVAPTWDSCDGQRSTYGWTYPTVSVDFDGVTSPTTALTGIDMALAKAGWTKTNGSGLDSAYYWSRTLTGGHTATVQLLPGTMSSGDWSLQASTPPAAHPITGC